MQSLPSYSTLIKQAFLATFILLSSLTYAQRTLGLDKKGKVKRIHFYEGSTIKIKLTDNEKVSGTLNGIFDSSFVIDGRKILMSEVAVVYSTRKAMRFVGGALMVAGAFYISVDIINNLLNYSARGYIVSNSVWQPTLIAVGSGAILFYFSTRRSKVKDRGNFKIYNTTPIPITSEPKTE
jgi:small nuclear ribonucleoprotein (snRNP)-like protein